MPVGQPHPDACSRSARSSKTPLPPAGCPSGATWPLQSIPIAEIRSRGARPRVGGRGRFVSGRRRACPWQMFRARHVHGAPTEGSRNWIMLLHQVTTGARFVRGTLALESPCRMQARWSREVASPIRSPNPRCAPTKSCIAFGLAARAIFSARECRRVLARTTLECSSTRRLRLVPLRVPRTPMISRAVAPAALARYRPRSSSRCGVRSI